MPKVEDLKYEWQLDLCPDWEKDWKDLGHFPQPEIGFVYDTVAEEAIDHLTKIIEKHGRKNVIMLETNASIPTGYRFVRVLARREKGEENNSQKQPVAQKNLKT